MSLPFVRSDLPPPSSFTVTQLPWSAKLDQNESAVDVPDEVKRAVVERLASAAWNRYPQPAQYAEAKRALAAVLGVEPERVCVTVGADQAILAAFHLAGGPGRRARWFEPTYPYFALAAQLTHTEGDGVVMGGDFDEGIEVEQVVAAPSPHLMVFAAPNNPSGASPRAQVIEAALDGERRLVLVDEAYAEFAGATRLADAGARHRNLVVARSLSKSLLAGVRLGLLVGHPELIGAAETLFTAPYHLNALQLVLVAGYAEVAPHVGAAVRQVIAERERLRAELAAIDGITPYPSRANFVLFRVAGPSRRATELHGALARAGVRVRDVGGLPGLAGHLRVTVGTPADNDAFLTALRACARQFCSVPS